MSKKPRRYFSPEQKVRILREHFLEEVPVSDICDRHGLHPTVFHRWMKEFFENGALAFQKENGTRTKSLEKKVAKLEGKLSQKNEVLSELMEEHVHLKKTLGET